MVWQRLLVSKHTLRTILCTEIYPLQRPLSSKVILASDRLPQHSPAPQTILFALVQMVFHAQPISLLCEHKISLRNTFIVVSCTQNFYKTYSICRRVL